MVVLIRVNKKFMSAFEVVSFSLIPLIVLKEEYPQSKSRIGIGIEIERDILKKFKPHEKLHKLK